MHSPRFLYYTYGLLIESEFPIQQLRELDPDLVSSELARVEIKLGVVPDLGVAEPEVSEQAIVTRFGDNYLIRVAFTGDFWVTPNSVTVQKSDDAAMEDLLAYLVGTVLATVLHHSGAMPLHISALLSPAGAIAFTGDSGAGKSTIAAHVHEATGWPLISDDVSALIISDGNILLESGVLTVKLWRDTLSSLDRSSVGLKRGLQRVDKFHAINPEDFVTGRHPLRALIQLNWGESFELRSATGVEAFKIALGSVYRPEVMNIAGNIRTVTEKAMQVANAIQVFEMTRQQDLCVSEGIQQSLDFVTSLENLEA